MLDPHWVFLGSALSLLGCVSYARATIAGRARPNRVTWSLWAAAPLIGFLAQLDGGIGLPSVQTLGAGISPLIVLAASFLSRHGAVRITPFDLACGSIAVVALAAWLGLGHTGAAVLFVVLADGTAAIPTIRKAWRDPHSEKALFYPLVGLNSIVTMLTIRDWQPASWMFSVYMLVLAVVMIAILAVRRPGAAARAAGRPAVEGSASGPGGVHDDGDADQAQAGPDQVPPVGPETVDGHAPGQ